MSARSLVKSTGNLIAITVGMAMVRMISAGGGIGGKDGSGPDGSGPAAAPEGSAGDSSHTASRRPPRGALGGQSFTKVVPM